MICIALENGNTPTQSRYLLEKRIDLVRLVNCLGVGRADRLDVRLTFLARAVPSDRRIGGTYRQVHQRHGRPGEDSIIRRVVDPLGILRHSCRRCRWRSARKSCACCQREPTAGHQSPSTNCQFHCLSSSRQYEQTETFSLRAWDPPRLVAHRLLPSGSSAQITLTLKQKRTTP
ncbi:hypothetical protein ARZXY2_869 [Arthrobacter sp. ZXY-2]|nr:hypothetical protein ARZXY2_869 [Arthrobacter sp. ZXY-2]